MNDEDNSVMDVTDDEDEIENYEVSDDVRFTLQNLDVSEEDETLEVIEDELPENEINGDVSVQDIDNNQEMIDEENVEVIDEDDEEEENNIDLRRSTRINKGCPVDDYVPSFEGKSYTANTGIQQTMISDKTINQFQVYNELRHVACTQMQAKVGIKKHGDVAIAAMFKELKQLDQGEVPELNNRVVFPIDPTTLTDDEKRKALYAVNVIKEKRDGQIKGRTCADGSKQRKYLSADDSVASPTGSLDGFFATCAIDAKEKRNVVTYDVSGAFLQPEMPKKDGKVLLKLRDVFVDIMCDVNPEYKETIVYEKGKKTLYLLVLRSIYGCIEAALLWYEYYSKTLQEMGFKINPYDRCIANKMINGKQCTIVWYVDDNKISHMDEKVIDDIICVLEKKFGKFTITKGKKHTFLGMNMEFHDDGRVSVEMKNQIMEALDMIGEDVDLRVTSPAPKHLFEVDDNCEKLSERKSEIFHSVTAKLLYIMKRSRPDIETAISFLCKRVSKSDTQDWKKLKRVLAWLKGTINDIRYFGLKNNSEVYIKFWVNASYSIHPDMKSHTGGSLSLGHGTLSNKSSTQKLNTKSSTEAELVGLSEYLPYDIWMKNFLESQGYEVKENIIYQDNQSAMKMEKNGRNSCTGNSRHVSIRYFFVKDRVEKGEVSIVYCPTENMLADYFTKPLHGALFKKFRDVVMGYTTLEECKPNACLIKERVEK